MRPVAANTEAAVAAGYHALGVLVQPDSDWDAYYVPLAERVAGADASAPGMAWALAATREELAMRRDHGTEYGYAGYVLRPADPRWVVRPETAADTAAVHAVNAAAFPTPDEAVLVDALRADPAAWLPGLSRVATDGPDGEVAAYALLTRCRVGDAPALALAPVATAPEHQRRGRGRPWCGRCSTRPGCAASHSSWCSAIPRTTRGSASYRRRGTGSGPASTSRTRR